MRKKLILDLDTGIDDALAIAYALGSADEIDLIGITATYGNVAVPLAARNALAVLHLFGRDDVPVYPGVDHPIAPATLPKMRGTTPDERAQAYARWQNGGADGWQTDASWSPTPGSVAVHHPNGIGGAIIPDSPRAPEAPGSAVDFIITAAREYGPDLTIVPTGAMTTMATVFRNAPDLKDSGVNVTLMGGALTLPGNVSPAAEANISQDPEAADYRARPIAGHDLRVQLASRSRGPVPRPYHRRSFTAPGSRQTHPSRIGRQRAGIPRPFHDPRHRGRARVNDYASAGNRVLRQVRL